MDYTKELIETSGLDIPTLENIEKNRRMFSLVSTCGSSDFYLYMKAFLHVHAKYPYQYRHTSDDNSGYCLLYTVDGEGLLSLDDNTQCHLLPHTLCFWPYRNTSGVRIIASHWEHYMLFFDGPEAQWFFNKYKAAGSLKSSVPSRSKLYDMLISYERAKDFYLESPLRQLCYITSLLSEVLMLDTLSVPEDGIPKYLSDIRQLFDNEYNQYYSLDLLEKDFKINKYKIAKEFTHYYGTSPINYLSIRRIEAAKALLLTTDLKIHEIGRRVGYENTTHFINSFKKQTGVTPLNYKKNHSNIF